MIASILSYLVRIANWQRIPPLPKMLKGDYNDSDCPERRVMARYGCRDPRGVKRAMKRYRARSIDDLVAKLEHYSARRRIRERINLIVGRAVGGLPYDPHRTEIMRARSRVRSPLSERLRLEPDE